MEVCAWLLLGVCVRLWALVSGLLWALVTSMAPWVASRGLLSIRVGHGWCGLLEYHVLVNFFLHFSVRLVFCLPVFTVVVFSGLWS